MKKLLRLFVLTLTYFIICNFQFDAQAQVIVRVKPVRKKVVVVKPVKKRRNHVWVTGHWKWNKRTNAYVWTDGYWVRKRKNFAYIPGHWKHVRGGYKWIPGHWTAA